jgi:O-antigen/teichoic acid export membrane protein
VALAAALTLALLLRTGLLRRDAPPADLGVLLRFGIPLVPHSLAATLMSSADRIVLSGVGGAQSAGQYFAAFQIAAVLSVAAAATNQAWSPWIYRRLAAPSDATRREIVRSTYLISLSLLAGAALLAANASWLLPWIAGPAFEPAAHLLRWLAPAAAFSGMYYFVANHLFFTGRTGLLSIITVSCSALQLGLMYWLVPAWGPTVAATSTLIGAIAYWLATWAAAHRVSPMPWLAGVKGARA